MRRRRRRRRFVRFVLAVIILGVVVSGASVLWFQKNVLEGLPEDLSHLQNYRPPSSCSIYTADGTQIDRFYVERRTWKPLKTMPDIVWQAFVASEDRRFFQHKGVDPASILRAIWTNLQAGGISQGGSTITQQIVKNLVVGNQRTYVRKLKEAVLALRLERELSKEQLLELYINYVYLGSGNYGVEAAARDYFDVSAAEIDAGQAAMLAGLVPAPSRYDPRRNPDLAVRRRSQVLQRMVEEGYVDREDVPALEDKPVYIPRERQEGRRVGLGYLTVVRREIRRLFGLYTAFAHGFHVHTPLDLKIQEAAENALKSALHGVDERQGRRGVVGYVSYDDRPVFLAKAPGLRRDRRGQLLPPKKGDCFRALVTGSDLEQLQAGRWGFKMAESDREAKVRSRWRDYPRALKSEVRGGDVLRVCLREPGLVGLDPKPWAEGAAVVVENATGNVVALVGGYEDRLEGFIRATQARRQPGSSFKPYVYATALKGGMRQVDSIHDGPISLLMPSGEWWSPRNFDNKYFGRIALRDALARSLNTVSVRLARGQGVQRVIETAHAMGVRTPMRNHLSIALGSSEVTPLDQAIAYASIARMGVPTEPVFVREVYDADGKLLGRPGDEVKIHEAEAVRLPGGPLPRALPAGVAYELADMMRQVVVRGTARRARRDDQDRAGKTGTTNDYVDAWFVGFTSKYTVAVWVGSDGHASMGDRETGSKTALPAWIQIMDTLKHDEDDRFPVPDEAIMIRRNDQWYGLPRGKVPVWMLSKGKVSSAPLSEFPAPLPEIRLPEPPPDPVETEAPETEVPESELPESEARKAEARVAEVAEGQAVEDSVGEGKAVAGHVVEGDFVEGDVVENRESGVVEADSEVGAAASAGDLSEKTTAEFPLEPDTPEAEPDWADDAGEVEGAGQSVLPEPPSGGMTPVDAVQSTELPVSDPG